MGAGGVSSVASFVSSLVARCRGCWIDLYEM